MQSLHDNGYGKWSDYFFIYRLIDGASFVFSQAQGCLNLTSTIHLRELGRGCAKNLCVYLTGQMFGLTHFVPYPSIQSKRMQIMS